MILHAWHLFTCPYRKGNIEQIFQKMTKFPVNFKVEVSVSVCMRLTTFDSSRYFSNKVPSLCIVNVKVS